MTTYNVEITRVLKAPVESVWNAWSEDPLVKQWWGPRVFTAPLAKMDFREGGTSLLCMRSPDGFEMYNTWTYTKIVPFELIEFVHEFSDKEGKKISPASIGLPPAIPDTVPHKIVLKKIDNNSTEISITEYGYTVLQVMELSKAGMNECIDKMEACLIS